MSEEAGKLQLLLSFSHTYFSLISILRTILTLSVSGILLLDGPNVVEWKEWRRPGRRLKFFRSFGRAIRHFI